MSIAETTRESRWRRVPAFAAAVLLATALGSIVQTQINLAALGALEVSIPAGVRVQATLHDLGSFTLIYGVVVIVAMLPALAVAGYVARTAAPRLRELWYAAAGVVGLLVAFLAVDALTPVPGFFAATRTALGTLVMAATGAPGGWLFARLTRLAP